MKTMVLIAGLALVVTTGTAQAHGQPAGGPLPTAMAGVGRGGGADHDLAQRYCIVDPSMRTAALRRVCRSLGEWQVRGIDPRRMPRL